MADQSEFSRTVGLSMPGKIARGPPRIDAPGFKPTSSIPAKFETILLPGPRERKGFLSKAKRFHDLDHELPGPGNYHKPAAMEFTHDSIGKKGYGSLASKSERFKHRMRYTGPGPGEYKQRAPRDVEHDKYFNKAAITASFQSKIVSAIAGRTSRSAPPSLDPDRPAVVPETSDTSVSPGPGSYYSEVITRNGQKIDLLSSQTAGAGSAFKARERPPLLSGNVESPPPTAYYTASHNWDIPATTRSAPFTMTSGRDPIAPSHTAAAIIFNEDAPAKNSVPGPGTYELKDVASIETGVRKETGKSSSAFKSSKVVDKFGHRLDGSSVSVKLPGPGSYFQEGSTSPHAFGHSNHVLPSAPAITSSFVGSAPNHTCGMESPERMAIKAPGPAFYHPVKPNKKSYHLNVKKHYLPAT